MSIFSHVPLITLIPYWIQSKIAGFFPPLWLAIAVSHKMNNNHVGKRSVRSVQTPWLCQCPPRRLSLDENRWQASSNSGAAGSCYVAGFRSRGKLIARLAITERPQQNCTCQGCTSVTLQATYESQSGECVSNRRHSSPLPLWTVQSWIKTSAWLQIRSIMMPKTHRMIITWYQNNRKRN